MGRLLQARGLAVLQEQTGIAANMRLERSFLLLKRAVSYNPAQAESWMNLAFIGFKRGDCTEAANYAERAYYTASEEEFRQSAGTFAKQMKEWSYSPTLCKEKGALFHPYQGL